MIEMAITVAIFLLLVGGALILARRAKAVETEFVAESSLDQVFFTFGDVKGYDPALLKGIAKQESDLGRFRVGPSGELGLMQIHPVNFSLRPNAAPEDWKFNDRLSVEVATIILDDSRRAFPGNMDLWLASYNWGVGRVKRHLEAGGTVNTMPPVVQEYISRVKNFARGFGAVNV